MKRLVLIGEGEGEVQALPVLANRLLQEKAGQPSLYVDRDVIRVLLSSLVKWDRHGRQPNFSEWCRKVAIAARRRDAAAVLAVFDGDMKSLPAGSPSPFCAATAAESMAKAAAAVGAGVRFSLAVVFAVTEYETWIVAGAESLAGRHFADGRLALPPNIMCPPGDPESHGKRWLERCSPRYRPTSSQATLTELLDLQCVRAKKLRSFTRLEHALDQLLEAIARGVHVSTPC